MKKLKFTILSSFVASLSYGQQAITIQNATVGCTIYYAMAASSDCSSGCLCDYASAVGSIPPAGGGPPTTYVYSDALDFQDGVLGSPPHGWATGTTFMTAPPGWAWGEIRFTVDCGSGQCEVGAMGLPASNVCTISSTGTWTTTGCGGGITTGSYVYSFGDVVISFW